MTVLQVSNLWKYYGADPVVQDVSFSLAQGEIVGLLGPNGAGKSTTVSMLYGAVLPTRGEILIRGHRVPEEGRLARKFIGVVTQEDNLDTELTVYENLFYFGRYFGRSRKECARRSEELLHLVGLYDRKDHNVETLSGGFARRLALARALVSEPALLFLDEPTTGLDPDARQDFWRLIATLKQEGKAILLTTHYMDEANRLSDRLLLIQQGRIVDEGRPEELIERIVGREVVEVCGIAEEVLLGILRDSGSLSRPLSLGYLIALPENAEPIWTALQSQRPSILTRRPANLEDVFLVLTGRRLGQ